jgi:heat shock protein HslJ
MNRNFLTISIIAVLLLAACSPAGASPDLVGTSWELINLDGDPIAGETMEGIAVTLEFISSTEAGGSGGCNNFGAEYSANTDGSIDFSNIFSTLMACEIGGNVEAAYFAALDVADHYRVDGQTLTITGNGHELVFERTSEGT